MIISGQCLGRMLRFGAFTSACLISSQFGWAQTTQVVNPLRQPARPAELSGPVLAAPQTVESQDSTPRYKPPTRSATARETQTVRQAAYGTPITARRTTVQSVPQEMTFGTSVMSESEPGPSLVPEMKAKNGTTRMPAEGDIIYEGVFDATINDPGIVAGGEVIGPELVDGCYDPMCCGECCPAPCATICFDNVEVFAGVQGFTGPMNRGGTGSFGFNEGFNWGFALPLFEGAFGGQIGLRATQSDLSGAEFTDNTRQQLFLTGGVFRRVDWGMQAGAVVDYMSQDWYATTDLLQVRGEISWLFPCMHELGFWFTSGTNVHETMSELNQQQNQLLESWEPTDLYAFFYRRRFEEWNGAEARAFVGFSGQGDGLIGTDVHIPVGTNFGVETNFAYLVPQESGGTAGAGHEQESWNLALNVVWYPGCRNLCGPNYFRPLFSVADNGSFMVDYR